MYDLLIIRELKKINKNLSILVASYDKGYVYFKGNGFRPFNLGLRQEEELTLKASLRMWTLIRRFRPDLVVSDEVFIALHITKGLKIPSILITHWFFESFYRKHPMIPVVKKANHVLFVDKPEFHTIPFDFNVHLTFVGPVIREFDYTLKDKKRAKYELGIDSKDKVILVTTGGRYKDRNKLLELSVEVFKELKDNNLKLILLTGELYEEYSERFKNESKIIIKDYDWQIDRLMVASDIVICKGTFMTMWELAYLGIPSISIPDLDNPVDQVHVNKMDKYNITVKIDSRKLNKDMLLKKVKELLNSEEERKKMSKAAKKLVNGRGQREAAEEISYFVSSTLKWR
jgi:UDP-N-acetylglucosamine--N-acetylmuramyl-(pentapeptide) pyrophosphoryl-undecaprenol N-acetylglucosamine transferase